MRRWILFAACLIAAYAAYCGTMYHQQRGMLFPGTAVARWPEARRPQDAQPVVVPASFGAVHALFLPARGRSRAPAVIVMHGNFQFVDEIAMDFDPVRALGVNVLLLEYPGYAGTPGSPSFESLREASVRAYDWLAAHPRVDASRIVAFGASIGGGPAAQLTADRPVRALILLSTFRDIAQFARERYLPAAIVRDPFDNLGRVRDFPGPVLIVHGRRDEIIGFDSGAALAAAARRATFIAMDCGHFDCPYREASFRAKLAEFLARNDVLVPESPTLASRGGVGLVAAGSP